VRATLIIAVFDRHVQTAAPLCTFIYPYLCYLAGFVLGFSPACTCMCDALDTSNVFIPHLASMRNVCCVLWRQGVDPCVLARGSCVCTRHGNDLVSGLGPQTCPAQLQCRTWAGLKSQGQHVWSMSDSRCGCVQEGNDKLVDDAMPAAAPQKRALAGGAEWGRKPRTGHVGGVACTRAVMGSSQLDAALSLFDGMPLLCGV
jgi:hypothetical protein